MENNSYPLYEVAAYYFPQYHPDPRNDAWHGSGWTEWEMVKAARPRYPGHRQPIVPAWGYFNEADPAWASREIDLAADYGITSFLYDWYWYDGRPFLHDALEKGFLAAPNSQRLKFALMWANHNWLNLYPTSYGKAPTMLTSGRIALDAFDRLVEYVIEQYFSRPNYLKIDGEPYFSIFELGAFIDGMGGLAGAEQALERFRAKTLAAGFPGLHINTMVQKPNNLPGEAVIDDPVEVITRLHFSSTTTYNWHQLYIPTQEMFPRIDYATAAAYNYTAWDEFTQRFPVPYIPGVTMGWDPSPRTDQHVNYELGNYPWTGIYEGNTPAAFKEALRHIKAFLDHATDTRKMFTINAWNEWTEGSYLLPDTMHGTAYLEAIKEIFGVSRPAESIAPEKA